MKMLLAILYGALGQAISFVSFQGSYKYKILQQNEWLIYLSGIPAAFAFYKSVHYFADYYKGDIYPSRFIGFAVGIIVFAIMSNILFNESVNIKTIICISLSICIILVQTFMK